MKNLIKIILSLVFLGGFVTSCEKNDEESSVTYRISQAKSDFTVKYRDEKGNLLQEQIQPQSMQDEWNYIFTAEEGDIVYVSAIYKDISSGIKVQVLVNGKVYKQASSLYDTLNYVTVGGTVPFN